MTRYASDALNFKHAFCWYAVLEPLVNRLRSYRATGCDMGEALLLNC